MYQYLYAAIKKLESNKCAKRAKRNKKKNRNLSDNEMESKALSNELK